VLRTGGTAGHHGRYGEWDFALLLALQKGTGHQASKARQQGKEHGSLCSIVCFLIMSDKSGGRLPVGRPSLSPPPEVRFRGEAVSGRQNRLNW
jgi:hypothetical protein